METVLTFYGNSKTNRPKAFLDNPPNWYKYGYERQKGDDPLCVVMLKDGSVECGYSCKEGYKVRVEAMENFISFLTRYNKKNKTNYEHNQRKESRQ